MFIFKVTGPSNEIVNRTISGSYYPDYYNLNTLAHISEAFIATMSHFIRYANLVFLLLLGLLTDVPRHPGCSFPVLSGNRSVFQRFLFAALRIHAV